MKIAWHGKHFGEEPPLVGSKNQGAGAVFFSGCNLRCCFCQNHQISQQNIGRDYSVSQLAEIFLQLQKDNAATIDLVTPTIWWRDIREAVLSAREKGLRLPIVWNSNGFESEETLKQLGDIVDVYLPDFKYVINETGEKYSGIKNYSKIAQAALSEMLRQKGDLLLDERGIAKSGVLVRHLVLPNNLENSFKTLDILAKIDHNLFISLMCQYKPLHQYYRFPELGREVTEKEFEQVADHFFDIGLKNGFIQEYGGSDNLIPDFSKEEPFKTV